MFLFYLTNNLARKNSKETHTGCETTQEWINDDRINIFGWTIPWIKSIEYTFQHANIWYTVQLIVNISTDHLWLNH